MLCPSPRPCAGVFLTTSRGLQSWEASSCRRLSRPRFLTLLDREFDRRHDPSQALRSWRPPTGAFRVVGYPQVDGGGKSLSTRGILTTESHHLFGRRHL